MESWLQDLEDDAVLFIVQIIEITERLQVEQHFRLLVNNAYGTMIQVDAQGVVRWISESLTDMLGWSAADWLGRSVLTFVPEEEKERLSANINHIATRGKHLVDRYRALAKDGSVHWVETHAAPFVDVNGNLDGVLGSCHVIDARVAAEDALRLSEQRHRLLAEHAKDVIWTMELDGRISFISPAIMQLRGFTPDEAMAQRIEQFHPPVSLAISLTYFQRLHADIAAGRSPTAFKGELEYYCKDGSTCWTEVQ